MVDIVDSKSTALKACGFDSHLPYHQTKITSFIGHICFNKWRYFFIKEYRGDANDY